MLRIAIQSKGRLNEESLSLLQNIGIEVDAPKRKLLSKSQTFPIEALYLRDDLLYHLLVLMEAMDCTIEDLERELALRHR